MTGRFWHICMGGLAALGMAGILLGLAVAVTAGIMTLAAMLAVPVSLAVCISWKPCLDVFWPLTLTLAAAGLVFSLKPSRSRY